MSAATNTIVRLGEIALRISRRALVLRGRALLGILRADQLLQENHRRCEQPTLAAQLLRGAQDTIHFEHTRPGAVQLQHGTFRRLEAAEHALDARVSFADLRAVRAAIGLLRGPCGALGLVFLCVGHQSLLYPLRIYRMSTESESRWIKKRRERGVGSPLLF